MLFGEQAGGEFINTLAGVNFRNAKCAVSNPNFLAGELGLVESAEGLVELDTILTKIATLHDAYVVSLHAL